MKRQIWKFPLPATETPIEMPENAEILCVQAQYNQPCIWAVVDIDADVPRERRRFRIIGTGTPLPDSVHTVDYIGTFQLDGGTFIFHVFEEDVV